MKKIFAITGLSMIVLISSCSKKDSGTTGGDNNNPPTPPTPPKLKTLTIQLSQDTLENNGFESATIAVIDTFGKDITATSVIAIDGIVAKSTIFYPTVAAEYNISATSGNMAAPAKKLTVVAPTASPFVQKMLVEDFTGAWCGWCPRIAFELEAYTPSHPECIAVAFHDGQGTGDPYSYQYISTLDAGYGIKGFPTASVNRGTMYQDLTNTILDKALAKWAPLGISIATDTATAGTISGSVKVKFNVTTTIPMNISIMLVENKLFADQHNYIPDYGGDILTNFEYKNVLRKMFSSRVVDGDSIPVANIVKGNVYTLPFSFTTAGRTSFGSAYTAVRANCKIVAVVTYGKNSLSKTGVINVQEGNVGETKDYVN